jgi:hypothetical protein
MKLLPSLFATLYAACDNEISLGGLTTCVTLLDGWYKKGDAASICLQTSSTLPEFSNQEDLDAFIAEFGGDDKYKLKNGKHGDKFVNFWLGNYLDADGFTWRKDMTGSKQDFTNFPNDWKQGTDETGITMLLEQPKWHKKSFTQGQWNDANPTTQKTSTRGQFCMSNSATLDDMKSAATVYATTASFDLEAAGVDLSDPSTFSNIPLEAILPAGANASSGRRRRRSPTSGVNFSGANFALHTFPGAAHPFALSPQVTQVSGNVAVVRLAIPSEHWFAVKQELNDDSSTTASGTKRFENLADQHGLQTGYDGDDEEDYGITVVTYLKEFESQSDNLLPAGFQQSPDERFFRSSWNSFYMGYRFYSYRVIGVSTYAKRSDDVVIISEVQADSAEGLADLTADLALDPNVSRPGSAAFNQAMADTGVDLADYGLSEADLYPKIKSITFADTITDVLVNDVLGLSAEFQAFTHPSMVGKPSILDRLVDHLGKYIRNQVMGDNRSSTQKAKIVDCEDTTTDDHLDEKKALIASTTLDELKTNWDALLSAQFKNCEQSKYKALFNRFGRILDRKSAKLTARKNNLINRGKISS